MTSNGGYPRDTTGHCRVWVVRCEDALDAAPPRPAGLPAYFDRETFSRTFTRRLLMKRAVDALSMPRRIHDFIYSGSH